MEWCVYGMELWNVRIESEKGTVVCIEYINTKCSSVNDFSFMCFCANTDSHPEGWIHASNQQFWQLDSNESGTHAHINAYRTCVFVFVIQMWLRAASERFFCIVKITWEDTFYFVN